MEIQNYSANYGIVPILKDINLSASPATITAIMGRNGAGKTTLLKSIMGMTKTTKGSIICRVNGEAKDISKLPAHEIPSCGIGYVPQGRRLFGQMSVAENLQIGMMAGKLSTHEAAETLEYILQLFPRLKERYHQLSGTLSGGEQQMVAVGRALCLKPSILLLDEPTEGLQPSMINLIKSVILACKAKGIMVFLVEQRIDATLAVADNIAFMENGRIAKIISTNGLSADNSIFLEFVGV